MYKNLLGRLGRINIERVVFFCEYTFEDFPRFGSAELSIFNVWGWSYPDSGNLSERSQWQLLDAREVSFCQQAARLNVALVSCAKILPHFAAMPVADIEYREYFTPEKIADLKETFESFDSSGDGRIGADELYGMFKKLGKNLTRSQIREVMREVDADGSGEIEFEELCILEIKMARLRPRTDLISYTDYLDPKSIQQLEDMFDRMDTECRGRISILDMKSLLEAQGIQGVQGKVSEDEIDEIISEVEQGGELEFEAFAAAWAIVNKARKRINYREFLDKEEVEELKTLFDDATLGSGYMAVNELDHLFRRLGFAMKTKQLRGLLRDFDCDGSGEIDFEEFCVMMLRLKCSKPVRQISPENSDCRTLWLEEDFSAKELQRSGYGIAHMKAAGIPVRQILTADVTALELRKSGFSASELRKAGTFRDCLPNFLLMSMMMMMMNNHICMYI